MSIKKITQIFALDPWELTEADILTVLQTPWQVLAPYARSLAEAHKGRHVFVRGLVEFSNICRRNCRYCGLRFQNKNLHRYRLTQEEILQAVACARQAGVDTVVLQSGEVPCAAWLGEVVRQIKSQFNLPVTLSVGEHSAEDYALWRDAGADRYLIKHETADAALYAALHPGHSLQERLRAIGTLQHLGYEVGGGFMIGLPGQNLAILARDILLCRDLRLSMIGAGPFLAQDDTPLAGERNGTTEMTLRTMAALRLANPEANIPATTALATLDAQNGQANGLWAGGNVLMPSFTPPEAAALYTIYDNKNRVSVRNAAAVIESLGMTHPLKMPDSEY